MSRPILSDYLDEIARIRGTGAGTKEISFYGALAGALNAAGRTLKPRVFCVPNLSNRGAGFPDMGLFVAQRGLDLADWPEGRPPERGVVEVDDIPSPLATKRDSAQVQRYLAAYGLVLVTNYRDFVLLGRGRNGETEERERFSFGCADADAFFALARSTRRPAALASSANTKRRASEACCGPTTRRCILNPLIQQAPDLTACRGERHVHAAVHKLRKLHRETVRRRAAVGRMDETQENRA
jgi:hypothetical protein